MVAPLDVHKTLVSPSGQLVRIQGEAHNYTEEESRKAAIILQENWGALGFEDTPQETWTEKLFYRYYKAYRTLYVPAFFRYPFELAYRSILDRSRLKINQGTEPRSGKNPTLVSHYFCPQVYSRHLLTPDKKAYCESKYRLDELINTERASKAYNMPIRSIGDDIPVVASALIWLGTFMAFSGLFSFFRLGRFLAPSFYRATSVLPNHFLMRIANPLAWPRLFCDMAKKKGGMGSKNASLFAVTEFIPGFFLWDTLCWEIGVIRARDVLMADHVEEFMETNHRYKTLIVVGALHVQGISDILKSQYGFREP